VQRSYDDIALQLQGIGVGVLSIVGLCKKIQ